MRKTTILLIALALVLAALLPFTDHADQATCCTATSSLASTVNNPVNGDESFFSLPTGPSNVMFLLDTSGSMLNLPQCGDSAWDASGAPSTCTAPTLTVASPSCTASGATTVTCTNSPVMVTGTCAPDTDGYTTTASNLKWMEAVVPQAAYPDTGQTNALLWDCPLWGNGGAGCGTRVCSGDGCLFDPSAYYPKNSWSISGTSPYSPSATRYELDGATGTARPNLPACTALDTSGNPLQDYAGNLVSLGSACTTCMQNHGFFFYKVSYVDSVNRSGSAPNYTYTPHVATMSQEMSLFKGTFLNANPPKFVTARQVLKANAWMDPNNARPQDRIRLGLSILDSSGSSPRKAQLIVPLGPDKGGSYPATQAGFRQARQYLISVLNGDPTKYTDAVGNTVVDGTTTGSSGFQNGFFNPANGSTPLASALLNIGQYFTTYQSGYSSLYNSLFGNGFTTSEFNETSAGRCNAAWVTKSGNTQCSICWGCQASSVVIITDGAPNSEITLPSSPTNLKTYDNAGYGMTSNCNGTYSAGSTVPGTDTTFKCESPSDGTASGLPRVGDWIHTLAASGKLAPAGLRYDLVLGGGQQAFRISTVGIGLTDPKARAILKATANLGNGFYANAKDPNSLAAAVANAVSLVAPREISFSAATSNSLQTVQTAASQAFITRFRPSDKNTWEGHVFEAFLFDEFLNGCDPSKATQPTVSCGQTTTKQVSADFNGDGLCNGTFLIDLDCDQIVEDPVTGSFLKLGTKKAANLPWDAGQVLSYETLPSGTSNPAYKSADETASNARNIFTWIGGNRVDFTSANAATIQPYLNISSSWCTQFLTGLGISGGSNPTLECAKQIIYYVRGWDVLDQDGDGCAGPNNTKNPASCQRGTRGEERDRPMDAAYATSSGTPFFWKLGDVVHSSPAVLQAPIDEIRCDTGYEKQCTWAIHSPAGIPNQTQMDASCNRADCYQDYRTANISRQRVLLIGANDGMLHAFHAGTALTSSPADITGSYPYDNGSGTELWAFIPPDMLPRLKDLMSAHQYMVDGSVMLRDIWVDGSAATDGSSTPSAITGGDGTKQRREFHTVAIFGRRAGGNQYSALDVTNPAAPTFLWNFPQTGSDDARYMGESWTDFAPRPPPIFPVKIATTGSSPSPDQSRGFSERWVVMFGGGYDPTLTLGRAVFMLDAWTGQTVWRFTDADFKANLSFTGASAPSMFPVPGGVGPLDIGNTTFSTLDVDGFFDTATWGDLGGNLFVARFFDPGVIGTAGRVGNWYAARAFEQLRRTDDAQYVSATGAGRNEFFYMTANAFEPSTHTIHTYLGSGNREQLMRPSSQQWCGTDNLFGCCQAGCSSVTATTSENDGSCSHSDTFSCVNGLLTHSEANSCPASGAACADSGNPYLRNVNLSWTCTGAGTVTASGSASFDGSGLGSVSPVGQVTTRSASFAAPTHNRFYGIVAYGGATTKTFSDQASAKVFDQNRSTDVSYSGTCSGLSCTLVNTTQANVTYNTATLAIGSTTCKDASTKCTATTTDPGWFYEYGDVCPLDSCASPTPWADEKTGAGANVILGCVDWGGFRPYGVATSSDPCSGNQGVPTVYDYSTNYITGAPSYYCSGATSGGQTYIAQQRSVTAAPGGSTVRVDINAQGQISYSSLQLDSGSPPSSQSAGTRSVGGAQMYWLQVPQQLHSCRHVDPGTCN
jgi:type IV pilus assembly protein PilY1